MTRVAGLTLPILLATVVACGGEKKLHPVATGTAGQGVDGGGRSGADGAADAGAMAGVAGGEGRADGGDAPGVETLDAMDADTAETTHDAILATDAVDATASALCLTYCGTIETSCTGARAQYKDMDDCLATCSFLPPGAPTDTAVNSIGCRLRLALKASTDIGIDQTTDCFEGGPLGYGACGEECDVYCGIALSFCSPRDGGAGAPLYRTLDDCNSACDQFARPDDIDFVSAGNYNVTDVEGDTLECRAFHLIVLGLDASGDPSIECPDAANESPVCISPPLPDGGQSDGPLMTL